MYFEIPMFFYVAMFAFGGWFFFLCSDFGNTMNEKEPDALFYLLFFTFLFSLIFGMMPAFCEWPSSPDTAAMPLQKAYAALEAWKANIYAFSILRSVGHLFLTFAMGMGICFVGATLHFALLSNKTDEKKDKEKEVVPPQASN